jgi:hypothetical protein
MLALNLDRYLFVVVAVEVAVVVVAATGAADMTVI